MTYQTFLCEYTLRVLSRDASAPIRSFSADRVSVRRDRSKSDVVHILFRAVVKPHENHIFFSMRTQRAVQPVCCDSVLFQEHHSAHGMCIPPRCIEPFVLQYFSAMKYNNSLSCSVFIYMLLPNYCAIHEKNINFIVYIYM